MRRSCRLGRSTAPGGGSSRSGRRGREGLRVCCGCRGCSCPDAAAAQCVVVPRRVAPLSLRACRSAENRRNAGAVDRSPGFSCRSKHRLLRPRGAGCRRPLARAGAGPAVAMVAPSVPRRPEHAGLLLVVLMSCVERRSRRAWWCSAACRFDGSARVNGAPDRPLRRGSARRKGRAGRESGGCRGGGRIGGRRGRGERAGGAPGRGDRRGGRRAVAQLAENPPTGADGVQAGLADADVGGLRHHEARGGT